jgi:hypothetical protein
VESSLAEHEGDVRRRERRPDVRRRDDPCHHGQDDQPEHVIDNRGTEDDTGLRRLRPPQVAKDPGGDAHAGGGEHRAEEDVDVHAVVGEQHGADRPTQSPGSQNPQHRDGELVVGIALGNLGLAGIGWPSRSARCPPSLAVARMTASARATKATGSACAVNGSRHPGR